MLPSFLFHFANTLLIAVRPLKLLRKRPPESPQAGQQLDLFSQPAGAAQYAGETAAQAAPTATPVFSDEPSAASAPPAPTVPFAAPEFATPASQVSEGAWPGATSSAAGLAPDPRFPSSADGLLQHAPPAPALPGQRRLLLGQLQLVYQLRRSKRRTIGFMIDDDGLRVTAPKWVGVGEIENAIREKQRWILAKLHEQRERATRRLQPQMQWRDGGMLPYLGGQVMLRIVASANAGVTHDALAQTLTVSLPPDAGEQQLKDRVQAWLQGEAKRLFAERLPVYAEKLDVTYRAFTLSSATTQWGACTADGRIRLNWRLVHFALPLIDYVIAHELSHLREMNHGPRFWETVQSVFPEFAVAKKALRDHAPETLPAF